MWAALTAIIIFNTLRALEWLRIPHEEEVSGLNMSHHGGSMYDADYAAIKHLTSGRGTTSMAPGVAGVTYGGAVADVARVPAEPLDRAQVVPEEGRRVRVMGVEGRGYMNDSAGMEPRL